MERLLKKYILLLTIITVSAIGQAQVLPVGTPVLEDYYRRLQLLGKLDSTISFSIRPLTNQALKQQDIYHPTDISESSSIQYFADDKGFIQLMPLDWRGQFVSSYPYGWNDGGMIPAKGFQTYLSAGVYAEYKFLSIQLKPEFVSAQNSVFDSYRGRDEKDWQIWWTRYANMIDMPERFGNGAYTRFFPGQSSIRLNFHPISIGISTENLWWGPGMRNSLLMSNTAPGFLHGTINTTRPIKTGIGSFEGQLVGGRLNSSGFTPKQLSDDDYHDIYAIPKPDDWRYFSGLVLSYQPKWVSGLTLGLINVFTVNSKDMGNKLGDYIPFFPSGSSSPLVDPTDPASSSDMAAQDRNFSVFARWMVPGAHFEIYGEYARNDHSWDTRDLLVSPNHSRSYMVGMRKLVPLGISTGDLLQISAELTQLEPSKSVTLRDTGPMYQHYIVRGGYTNLGQLLGAGVGVGNNIQSLQVSWIRDLKQIGVQIERLVHNNDFMYHTSKDLRSNWVDLGLSLNGQWDYGRFLFSSGLQLTRAFNYQYRVENRADFWKFGKQDKMNLFFNVGAFYRL